LIKFYYDKKLGILFYRNKFFTITNIIFYDIIYKIILFYYDKTITPTFQSN